MSRNKRTVVALRSRTAAAVGNRIGAVVGFSDGSLVVDYPANPFGPIPAHSTIDFSEHDASELVARRASVLLGFVDERADQPVIVGLIRSPRREPPVTRVRIDETGAASTLLDGKHIVFEAEASVELRCGKASITLTKDGAVTIRGAYVTSYSSGTNRIRGGSVEIN